MSDIIHLSYKDILDNSRELGACNALGRFLEEGIKDRISGSFSRFTLEDLRDFAEELNGRLRRIKV
ncbi:hypothetical protein EBZ80_07225 [bacterium]|nr:hypothetical protein [bacterium]